MININNKTLFLLTHLTWELGEHTSGYKDVIILLSVSILILPFAHNGRAIFCAHLFFTDP